MKATRTLAAIAPLGLIVIVAACSATEGNTATDDDTTGEEASAQSGVIDVAASSQMSLSLRGGLGPIVEGRTVTKAIVTVEDVELVSESGRSVVLSGAARRVDLLAFQNDLDQLVAAQSIEVDRYKELRFRLRSAWIETIDDQQVTRVFASEEVDRSEFAEVQNVGRLELQGLAPDGFVSCALPDAGIHVEGTASLAIHFALAESLSMQSADTWVLDPRAWCVDASSFSSLDVQFQLTEETYTELSQGYSVMLLDAGLRPVCRADLTRFSSTSLTATFRFLESFEGPFVAVLLPPSGIALDNSVAVSVDVSTSVHVETHVSVTSVQRLGRTGNVTTVSVRTADDADVIEHNASGVVTGRHRRPIGGIDNVAPHTGPREPLRPGEHAPPPSAPPTLPGLPPPRHGGGPGGRPQADAAPPPPPPPTGGDAGRPPPIGEDAGRPPRPPHDAGTPPPPSPRDAGAPPPPPQRDAGAPPPPPQHDAGAPPSPPQRDAGAPPPPRHDAGAPPPPPPPPHASGTPKTPPPHPSGTPNTPPPRDPAGAGSGSSSGSGSGSGTAGPSHGSGTSSGGGSPRGGPRIGSGGGTPDAGVPR